MAKEAKRNRDRKSERYSGMSDEEWKEWSGKFGKRMEKRGKEFGEEIKDISERFERHMDRRAERLSRRMERKGWGWGGRWFTTFGFMWPLFGSIFGLVFLLLMILVLDWINLSVKSNFILLLSVFILTNLHWFFAASLIFGYSRYFSRTYRNIYWIVSPILSGIKIFFLIWFMASILNIISLDANSSTLGSLSNFLYANMWSIPLAFVIIFYFFVMFRRL